MREREEKEAERREAGLQYIREAVERGAVGKDIDFNTGTPCHKRPADDYVATTVKRRRTDDAHYDALQEMNDLAGMGLSSVEERKQYTYHFAEKKSCDRTKGRKGETNLLPCYFEYLPENLRPQIQINPSVEPSFYNCPDAVSCHYVRISSEGTLKSSIPSTVCEAEIVKLPSFGEFIDSINTSARKVFQEDERKTLKQFPCKNF
eukprot:TRINITY_DN6772_c0_g1_i1.p1 TRINITY_DN6772_c0_g1~~TRINITY_DN6772_c0_g1_i1.p1  ORF type:complete len:205 (-),score=23.12 TRINITY_DN6772_c0_g1_i1:169-783(-)